MTTFTTLRRKQIAMSSTTSKVALVVGALLISTAFVLAQERPGGGESALVWPHPGVKRTLSTRG
jgi:hypothetical protein